MRDYTINNYCDFLWISDLITLKKNHKNMFQAVVTKNNKKTSVSFANVAIFGTIIEIKQIGLKNYLYHVDDGTAVIVCKHSEDQFENAISVIESEQDGVLSQTLSLSRHSGDHRFDSSTLTDTSLEDSIFNEKSIQDDEMNVLKRNTLTSLQTIWSDIYDSFTSLLGQYKIGDTVFVEGKLYSYFNTNQIYINSIRPLDLSEEMMKVSNRLRDGYNPLCKTLVPDDLDGANKHRKRLSGLMTFDSIPAPDPGFTRPTAISEVVQVEPRDVDVPIIVFPSEDSTMTYDTFATGKR